MPLPLHPNVLLVLALGCILYPLPVSLSQQAHFTRGVPSSDRSASELMTPPYQRRQDEYQLSLNCSPTMQHPATAAAYQVELGPSGRLHPSSGSRLTWLVKATESQEFSVDYAALIAFTMEPGCAKAEPVNPRALPDSQGQQHPVEFMAFVATQGCSVSQAVRAVRRIHRDSRLFMLFGPGDRAMRGDVHEDQIAQPNLCVFVYEQAPLAVQLAREMRNRTCSVSLSYRMSVQDGLINKTSVLFVSVSFILLMIISLSWLVFYYVQRFRYLHAKERLSRRLGNAAKKALTRIPVRILKPGDRDFSWIGDQCAVCIEPYRVSDWVRILPCKHFYHRSCIDPWLLDQRTCPLCKLDILKAYGLQIRDHRRGSHGSLMDGRLTPEDNSQAPDSMADSLALQSSVLGAAAAATATAVSVDPTQQYCGVVRISTQPTLMAQFNAAGSAASAASASTSVVATPTTILCQNHHLHHIHLQQQQQQLQQPYDDEVEEEAEVSYPLVHHRHVLLGGGPCRQFQQQHQQQ